MVDVARLRAVIELEDAATAPLNAFKVGWDTLARSMIAGVGFAAGIAGFRGLSAAMDGVRDAMIGLNSQLQTTAVTFKTLLGSAEAAKAMMQSLTDFALNTPFELKGLSQMGSRFLAMGFQAKQIIPLLYDIGNAAAALGLNDEGIQRVGLALSQMSASGRVLAQDMNQLTQANIPAWQILADAIGKPVAETRKLAEQGKISADIFLQAFENVARGRWGRGMADQADTFSVALSNAQEAVQALLAGGLKPLFDLITQGVVAFRNFTQTGEWKRWGLTIQEVARGAAAMIRGLMDALRPVGEFIRGFMGGLGDILGIPQQTVEAFKVPARVYGDEAKKVAEENPIGASLKAAQIEAKGLQLAVSDIKDAYGAAIAPLQAQADALAKQRDFAAEINEWNLDNEASALREEESRKRIMEAAGTTITLSGHIRRGKDPTTDLRLLDIESDKRKAKAQADWDEIQRQISLAPILQGIKDLEAAQKAQLQPLEDQLKFAQRRIDLLEIEKGKWDAIKDAASDVVGIVNPGGGAADAGIPLITPGALGQAPLRGGPIDWLAKGREVGEKIAAGLGEAFGKIPGLLSDAFKAVWDWTPLWVAIYDIQHAITRALSPDGLKAWESWRDSFLGSIDKKVAELQPGIRTISYEIAKGLIANAPDIARGFLYVFKEGLLLTIKATTWLGEIGFAIGEGIGIAIGQWLRGHWSEVIRFALAPPGTPQSLIPFPQLPTPGAGQPAAAPGEVTVTIGEITLGTPMSPADYDKAAAEIARQVLEKILAAQQAAA